MYRSVLTVLALSTLALAAAVVASLLHPATVAVASTTSVAPAVLTDDTFAVERTGCPALEATAGCPYLARSAASSGCPYLAALAERSAASRCPALGGTVGCPRSTSPDASRPGADPDRDPILRASYDATDEASPEHS